MFVFLYKMNNGHRRQVYDTLLKLILVENCDLCFFDATGETLKTFLINIFLAEIR